MSSNSQSKRLSVIVPMRNEAASIAATIEGLRATLPADAEIIVVDDGSTDDSVARVRPFVDGPTRLLRTHRLGPARARNYGASCATGELLIFADAHIQLSEHWWQPLTEALDDRRVGLVGPGVAVLGQPESKGYGYQLAGPQLGTTWLGQAGDRPYPVPCVGGCFQMVRRELFDTIGGYDTGMRGWGAEDTELSIRVWLLGYEVLVDPRVVIEHLFRPAHPYPIDLPWLMHNDLRMAFVHLNEQRVMQIVHRLKQHEHFAAGLARAIESDVWERRADLERRRVRDDDWYFERFEMNW